MTDKHIILAIGADFDIWLSIKGHMDNSGYDLRVSASMQEASKYLTIEEVSLVLIDSTVSDADHLDIVRQIKNNYLIPVIIIDDQQHSENECVLGLEIGADDYISKPVNIREVIARIKANIRLVKNVTEKSNQEKESEYSGAKVIQFDKWYLDLNRHELLDKNKEPVDMTSGEIALLTALVKDPRKALDRDKLFDITRGRDYEGFDRAIDVQISRIRQKLQDDKRDKPIIKTVRGIGYMLDSDTVIIE